MRMRRKVGSGEDMVEHSRQRAWHVLEQGMIRRQQEGRGPSREVAGDGTGKIGWGWMISVRESGFVLAVGNQHFHVQTRPHLPISIHLYSVDVSTWMSYSHI